MKQKLVAFVLVLIVFFFLQIQGSGRLKLENQKIIKVRFAGSNNKKYTSLGKILIQYGHMEKKNIATLQGNKKIF